MKEQDFMNTDSAKFKLILISILIVIALITIGYNTTLMNILREKERQSIELWAKAIEYNGTPQHAVERNEINRLKSLINESNEIDSPTKTSWIRLLEKIEADLANSALDFVATEIIIKNRFEVPSLVADSMGNVLYSRNITDKQPDAYWINEFGNMNPPISIRVGDGNSSQIQKIYYGESNTIYLLKFFPFIQIGSLLLFVGLAYYSWSSIRQNEQSNVWVGMAKEAAHQLGTPLSSLYGWLTLLNDSSQNNDKELIQEAVFELNRDASRIQKVADRFNKIGSSTDLQITRVETIINYVLDYLEPRIPRLNKGVKLIRNLSTDIKIPLNPELFEWAIENVVKNAIDAIIPKLENSFVKVETFQEEQFFVIEITDNGKGIEKKNAKNIFKPGFSTKKRGWGLGLSLTKRIVEEYHNGRIELIQSDDTIHTTFRMYFPIEVED